MKRQAAIFWRRAGMVLDPDATGIAALVLRSSLRIVIALVVAAIVAGSVPETAAVYGTPLTAFVVVVSILAGIETGGRFALAMYGSAPLEMEGPSGRKHGPLAGMRWLASPSGLIDLAAILPLAAWLAGHDAATVRLLGMVLLLKLLRYTPAFDMLARVMGRQARPLAGVMSAFLIILLLAATLAHVLEGAAQPAQFGTIPRALWWAITTLTTTGYGDEIPVTGAGRMLGGVVMVCGIAVFALWAGILANGFAEEVRRRDFLRTWELVARVPLFSAVGAGTIAEVTRLLQPREVPAGRTIVRKGEAGQAMYFIVVGEVEVQLGASRPRLGAGAFFGEMALITGAARVATVVSTSRTQLLVLDLADFRSLAAARPELTQAIEAEAARRGAG